MLTGAGVQRLQRVAGTPPSLGAEARVIDVGSGTGALIPFLQVRASAADLHEHNMQKQVAGLTHLSIGDLRSWGLDRNSACMS